MPALQDTCAATMTTSTNEVDPFLKVQQEFLSQLASTRPLFSSYLRIRSLSTAPSSPELASARADLEAALVALTDDLADLVASVRAVESDPVQYGLSADEVARRQSLIRDANGEIEDMHEELDRAASLSNGSSNGKNRARHSASLAGSGAGSGTVDPDDGLNDYTAFEQQQQLEMMRDQNQHLDGVIQTVGNLRRQADDMGRELEEQHEMLDLVDQAADRVSSRLQNGMQKLQYVIRNNEDRWSSCCIAVIILILIILLVLLLIV